MDLRKSGRNCNYCAIENRCKLMSLLLIFLFELSLNINNSYSQVRGYTCNSVIKRYSASSYSKLSYYEPIKISVNDALSFQLKNFDFINTILAGYENQTMNFDNFDEANFNQSTFIKQGINGELKFKQYEGSIVINTRNRPVFLSTRVNFIYRDNISSLNEIQLLIKGYSYSYILILNPDGDIKDRSKTTEKLTSDKKNNSTKNSIKDKVVTVVSKVKPDTDFPRLKGNSHDTTATRDSYGKSQQAGNVLLVLQRV
jgi:hypothetical protein